MKSLRLLATAFAATLSLAASATDFYAINEGNWSNPDNWTLNPDGVTFSNPSNLTPSAGDNVIIESGKVITLDVNMLDLGYVVVNGELHIANGKTIGFAAGKTLDGVGLISMYNWGFDAGFDRSNNLFSAKGTYQFKGTARIQAYGTYTEYFNINVESGAVLNIGDRITINGELHVSNGGKVVLEIPNLAQDINDIYVAQGGILEVSNIQNNIDKRLSVRGNIECYGTMTFCSDTSKPHGSADKQVMIAFAGNQDQTVFFGSTANVSLHGFAMRKELNASLGRNANVFVHAASGATVNFRSNVSNKDLIEYHLTHYSTKFSSTLTLGDNINISRLGKGFDQMVDDKVCRTFGVPGTPITDDLSGDNSFCIPEGNELCISGANINMGADGDLVGYIFLRGKLRMVSGSLSMNNGSHGIVYCGNKAELSIEGGTITTTSVYPINDDIFSSLKYRQSAGKLSLVCKRTRWWYGSLYMREHNTNLNGKEAIFEMSGGEIEISHAAGQGFYGIYLDVAEANQNVSGGTITITNGNPSGRAFKVQSNVKFYDLVVQSTNVDFTGAPTLCVQRDLTISDSGNALTNLTDLSVGRNLVVENIAAMPQNTVFDGTQNSIVSDNTTSGLTFGNLTLNKSNAGSTLTMQLSSKTLRVNGNITAQSGAVNASINMLGANRVILQGEGGSFAGSTFDFASATSPSLGSDVTAMNMTNLSQTKYLLLGDYHLTLTNATFAKATNKEYLFVTNGNACGGGLTLPINGNQYFPIAAREGGSINCVSAEVSPQGGAAGTLTVEPGVGLHKALTSAEDSKAPTLPYFWRLTWDGTNRGNGLNLVFHHKCTNNKIKCNGSQYPSYYFNSKWYEIGQTGCSYTNASGATEGKLTINGFNKNTSTYSDLPNQFTVDIIHAKKQTNNKLDIYYSRQSGNWNTAATWTKDTTTNAVASVPPQLSTVVIRNGHTVTLNTAASGGSAANKKTLVLDLEVRGGGTLKVASAATHYKLSQITGNGTIDYDYAGNLNNWIVSDYAAFCEGSTSKIVLTLTNNWNNADRLPLTNLPNFSIVGGAHTAALRWATGQQLNIAGNFSLSNVDFRSQNMSAAGENIVVGKNLILDAQAKFDYTTASGQMLTVNGDIENAGTLRCTKGLQLAGNATNNGTMSVGTYNFVLVGNQNQVLQGSQPITIEALRLHKDVATNIVRVATPLATAAAHPLSVSPPTTAAANPLQFDLTTGKLMLDVAGHTWNATNIDYACLDILDNATLIVNNGTFNVASWRHCNGGAGSEARVGIMLYGGLELSNATMNTYVGQTYNGATINCGIAYGNTGHSALRLYANSTLNTGFIAPDDLENGTINYYQSGGTVNFYGANMARTVAYAVLDIQGGTFHTEGTVTMDFKQPNGSGAKSYFVNYLPAESNFSANTTLVFRRGARWDWGGVKSIHPLPNVNVVDRIFLQSDITFDGNVTVQGNIRTKESLLPARNITFKGNVAFNNSGCYDGNNGSIIYFAGANKSMTVGGNDPIAISKVVSNAAGTLQLPKMNITTDFEVNSGDVTLAGKASVAGDVTVENAASVAGQPVEMTGNNARLELHGALDRLTVNTTSQINAANIQNDKIQILKALALQSGHLNIGTNELYLGKDIQISAPGDATSTIASPFDESCRGISCQLNAGSLNIDLPLGLVSGSNVEYTPANISLSGASASSTDYLTLKPIAAMHIALRQQHNANALSALGFFWTIGPENLSLSGATGTFGVCVNERYARDFTLSGDKPYRRLSLEDGNDQWRIFDGGITQEDDMLQIQFPLNNTGDFTLANDVVDILSYISVANGNAFGAAIWKKYVDGAATGAALALTREQCEGVALIVENNVVVNQNQLSPFRIELRSSGTLDLGSTINHNFGRFRGTGRLRTARGQLPSIKSQEFFGPDGGTLELYNNGTTDYTILSGRSSVNHLDINGVQVKYNNLDEIIVHGNLTLRNSAQLQLGSGMDLYGNLSVATGCQIDNAASSGVKLLTFKGAASQTVDVPTSGINTNITINGAGISLQRDLNISRILTLTKGNVVLPAGNTLTIGEGATLNGGSAASFVDGALKMKVVSGANTRFAVGNAGRYGELKLTTVSGSDFFSASYINQQPTAAENELGTLSTLSDNEYWKVTCASATKARATLRWDTESDIDVSDVKVAVKEGTGSWAIVAHSGKTTTSSTAGNITTANGYACNSALGTLFSFALSKELLEAENSWTGLNGSDWNITSNWSKKKIPNKSDKVVIPLVTNQPIISASASAKANTIQVKNGATLTLDGGKLDIGGNLTAEGTGKFVVNHLVNSSASVITATDIANVKVRRQMQGRRTYYVGSVNASGVIDNYASLSGLIVKKYSPADETYEVKSDGKVYTGTIGRNFVGNWWLEQTATIPRLGSKTYNCETMTGESYAWHLLSNEWPVAIDLSSAQISHDDKMNPIVWLRTNNASGQRVWTTYNVDLKVGVNMPVDEGGNSEKGGLYIAPYQAFFMKVKNKVDNSKITGRVTINAAAKPQHISTSLKSNEAETSDVLRFALSTNEGIADEAALVFRNGSFAPADNDADKYVETDGNHNTLAINKDGHLLAIASLPEANMVDEAMIELSVATATNAATATIETSNIAQFCPWLEVVLVDRLMDLTISLRENPSYIFDVTDADSDRFALLLRKNDEVVNETVTGVNAPAGAEGSSTQSYTIVGSRAAANTRGIVVDLQRNTNGTATATKRLQR